MIEAEPLHPTAPAAAGPPPSPAADGRARREGDADVERVQLDSEARTHRNRLRIATLAFWSLLGLLESAIAYVRLSGSPR